MTFQEAVKNLSNNLNVQESASIICRELEIDHEKWEEWVANGFWNGDETLEEIEKEVKELQEEVDYIEVANNYELWTEYVDTVGVMTQEEFELMTEKEKIQLQVDLFGIEVV